MVPSERTGPHGGKLRIVVINAPYDTLDDPLTQELLGKLVALKIAGYQKEYPYGVLPVDTGDFVGTHLIVCEELDGKLSVLMGYKSISVERCETHHLKFPIFHLLEFDPLENYRQAVRDVLSEAASKGESVAYNASWTISPEVSRDTDLRKTCVDLTVAMMYFYYTEYKIPNIVAAAIRRFKVDRLKIFIGYNYLKLGETVLPPVMLPTFFNEVASVMHLREFTPEAIELSMRYLTLWEKRITLERRDSQVQKKAA